MSEEKRIDMVIKDKDGQEMSVVRFIKPNKLLVWRDMTDALSDNKEICCGCDVKNISMDELKRIDVWDKLDKSLREEIEAIKEETVSEIEDRMAKARASRKSKYANVPKELICTKCNAKIVTSPAILVARVDNICKKKGILFTVEDYVKDFQCQKCRPTRGRGGRGRSGDAEKTKFIELKCKCGYTTKYPSSYMVKRAEEHNTTIEKLIKEFACQKCKPTKGRHKKN